MNKDLELLKLYFTKKMEFQLPNGEDIVYDEEELNENRLVIFNRKLDIRIYIVFIDGNYEIIMQGRPTYDLSKYLHYFLKDKPDFFNNPETQEFIRMMDIEMAELLK